MRNIIFDKRVLKSWALYLPLVQRIMNASVHHSTGVTPAQIMFGNAIDLDRGIFLEHIPGPNIETKLSKWISQMLKAQATIIEIARENLKDKDTIHIQGYDSRRTEFPTRATVFNWQCVVENTILYTTE